MDGSLKTDSVDERIEEKPSSSAPRPKEGRASIKSNLQILSLLYITDQKITTCNHVLIAIVS